MLAHLSYTVETSN